MFETEIYELIAKIKEEHPIFTDGYFYDPENENGFRGFTDEKSNYFFVELNEDETGNKYTLTQAPIYGCGGANASFSINIYFVLDTCKNKGLATQKLMTSIGGDWFTASVSDNENLIWQEMNPTSEKPYSSFKKLIRFTVLGNFLFTSNKCEDGLCANDCC